MDWLPYFLEEGRRPYSFFWRTFLKGFPFPLLLGRVKTGFLGEIPLANPFIPFGLLLKGALVLIPSPLFFDWGSWGFWSQGKLPTFFKGPLFLLAPFRRHLGRQVLGPPIWFGENLGSAPVFFIIFGFSPLQGC